MSQARVERFDPHETPGFEADELAEDWPHDESILIHGTFAEGQPDDFGVDDLSDLAGFPSMTAEYAYEYFEVADTGDRSHVNRDELELDVVDTGFEFTGRSREDVNVYNHALRVPAIWVPGQVEGYAHYTLDHVELP